VLRLLEVAIIGGNQPGFQVANPQGNRLSAVFTGILRLLPRQCTTV